jgi:predicted secreted Zn-dependent protease
MLLGLLAACGPTPHWLRAQPIVAGYHSLDAQAAGLIAERWFGVPSLWVPPPIPSTTIEFFDVSGSTQRALINSLNSSDICAKNGGCSPDPAVPNGVAWGLEGEAPFGFDCYSPRTTPVPFNVFVLLPRWSPFLGSVTVSLVTKWNALEQMIYVHEAGHAAISVQDLYELGAESNQLSSCQAVFDFWDNQTTYSKLEADQAAYHARLHADCRPEIGCAPPGWLGW